jgi:ABC-type glycerol-3-phosphate transport system substrate-binding protein
MIVVTIGALLLCAASAAFAGGSKESAGQGSMEDGPATITFWAWATTDKQEIINRALSEFHEGQNDVEVEFQAFPSGGYEEKILSAVASDTAPDVSFTKISFGQRFASENILTNMNNLGAEEMLDNILESSLAYGQYDGGTYMLPVNADNRFIAYNGDVLSKAGYTEEVQQGAVSWDQLRQMAADVSERDNQGNVRRIGFYVSPSWGGGWADFLYTAGGQLLNDNNTEAAFNTEAGLEALRLVLDLKEYSSQLQDEDAPFYNGNVAMIKKGSWDLPRFPREMPNTDWGIMPIPSPTGEVARGAGSLLAGIDIGIYESSQHKEASFELVQHFLSDSVQSWFPAEYGQFPVVESAYDTEDFQSYLDENPAYAKAAEWMQYTWPLPLIPEWSQISETLNSHIEQAWFDELSPEEALNQAEQEVNQILSE